MTDNRNTTIWVDVSPNQKIKWFFIACHVCWASTLRTNTDLSWWFFPFFWVSRLDWSRLLMSETSMTLLPSFFFGGTNGVHHFETRRLALVHAPSACDISTSNPLLFFFANFFKTKPPLETLRWILKHQRKNPLSSIGPESVEEHR